MAKSDERKSVSSKIISKFRVLNSLTGKPYLGHSTTRQSAFSQEIITKRFQKRSAFIEKLFDLLVLYSLTGGLNFISGNLGHK